MVSWLDQGAKVRVYIATNSDALNTGRRTTYPFGTPNGNGVPAGWTRYTEGDLPDFAHVTMSVKGRRFNMSNARTIVTLDTRYGIYRQFNINDAANYYVFTVQARTMKNKDPGLRGFRGYEVPGNSTEFWKERLTQEAFELVAAPIGTVAAGTTAMEVRLFTGDNTLGGNPVPTQPWGVQFANPAILVTPKNPPAVNWHEITCDVKECQTRYGRERYTSRYEVAVFSIVVNNASGQYSYQVPHPWNLRPGRWCKGTITVPGSSTEQPLFYGLIDSLQDGFDIDGTVISTITVVDPSNIVANVDTPTLADSSNSSTNSWLRARDLLYSQGLRNYSSDMDPNPFTQQAVYANGSSVRDSICVTAESEGARYFTDRSGIHNFMSRYYYPSTDNTVTANLLAGNIPTPLPSIDGVPDLPGAPVVCCNELDTDWARDRVINIVSIANVGGTAQVYEDSESQGLNGPYTYQRHDYVNWDDFDYYSDWRAEDILGLYKDAKLRVDAAAFSPIVNDCWPWLSTVWLNNLVRVWYLHPTQGWGFAVVTHIQSIVHTIGTKNWRTRFTLDQPYIFTRFTFSSVGWDVGRWDTGTLFTDTLDVDTNADGYADGWQYYGSVTGTASIVSNVQRLTATVTNGGSYGISLTNIIPGIVSSRTYTMKAMVRVVGALAANVECWLGIGYWNGATYRGSKAHRIYPTAAFGEHEYTVAAMSTTDSVRLYVYLYTPTGVNGGSGTIEVQSVEFIDPAGVSGNIAVWDEI